MNPKASVLLLTFNQKLYIKDALNSILSQDYENLEIIVSDDQSKDGTWEIIQQIIADHPRRKQVILNKNEKNMGVVGNYNKAFSLSSGDVIFTAAGDDISLPNRCSACIDFWLLNDKPHLIAADGYDMSFDGENLGLKKTDDLDKWNLERWSKKRPYFFGASHMMSRQLIEINTLDIKLPYEDQCFFLRGLLLNSVKRIEKPLVFHRRGGLSQPQKNYLYPSKKEALLKGLSEGYVELNQMLEDSKRLNKGSEFLRFNGHAYNMYCYGQLILKSQTKFEALRIFITYRGVKIFKKIRYLNYALIPSLMQFIYLTKKKYGKK